MIERYLIKSFPWQEGREEMSNDIKQEVAEILKNKKLNEPSNNFFKKIIDSTRRDPSGQSILVDNDLLSQFCDFASSINSNPYDMLNNWFAQLDAMPWDDPRRVLIVKIKTIDEIVEYAMREMMSEATVEK